MTTNQPPIELSSSAVAEEGERSMPPPQPSATTRCCPPPTANIQHRLRKRRRRKQLCPPSHTNPFTSEIVHIRSLHAALIVALSTIVILVFVIPTVVINISNVQVVPVVSAHGYLKFPRSRNLVAYQDTNWQTFLSANANGQNNDPQPEDCPHCLNRGGTLAQCGILFGTKGDEPWERNYDRPLNSWGDPMSPNIQAVYDEGSIIEVEVMVTTHHKGHFEFAACPLDVDTTSKSSPMEIPTEECFAKNKLKFVSDELYGAPVDPNYPERAYIIPATKATWIQSIDPKEQPVVGAEYKMKFQLPKGVVGDVVLLQWYYLTANSCKHEGYAEYPFPKEWGEDVALYPGLPDCVDVPEDGNGLPEQFWNCAEIKVVNSSSSKGGQPAPASAPNDEAAAALAMAEAAGVLAAANKPAPSAPAPSPPAPTPPQESITTTNAYKACADETSIYYEATEDCTGYFYCRLGTPDGPYPCGDGLLYNQAESRCDWADLVSCDNGGGSAEVEIPGMPSTPRPTKTPTQRPTGKPNALLDWDRDAANRGHDKTIIGYYASWQWYDREGLAAPKNMDFTKITRANFAFFQITEEGDIYGTDTWADPITLFGFFNWMGDKGDPQYCSWDQPGESPNCATHNYEEGLIYLAHQAGAEVYPSIGGWSLSDPFPAMAANAGARAHFANQCVELIKNYNFDGIDLDWEYPGYKPHMGTDDDTVNFNLLLDDVRAALDALEAETGKFYGLTAALPCGPSIIADQDIAHVSKVLTELNLMTYDFHGSWNDKTGVNAPLYDQNDSPELSVHGCVLNWLNGGATRDKINIGFPFYGRSFAKAQNLYEAHQGSDEGSWHEDEGIPQYYNILKKMRKEKFTSVRDDQTMTQYAYWKKGMLSYDDERAICDKTEYAQVHGLKGYIIWELSGDLKEDLSTPLLDAANAKLRDPRLDCARLDLSDAVVAASESNVVTLNDAPGVAYYPDFGGSMCVHEGSQTNAMGSSSSIKDCCEEYFNWNADCVQNSEADILSEVNGPAGEDVYYPASNGWICLHDGLQTNGMDTSNSAKDCCKKHFNWNADCVQNSETDILSEVNGLAADVSYHPEYYPDFDGSICLHDGLQTNGMDTSNSAKDCCEKHFDWNADCVQNSETDILSEVNGLAADVLYYPSDSAYICLSDGKHPKWHLGNLHDSIEACCEVNYGFSRDCVSNSIAISASAMDTATAVTAVVPETFDVLILGGNIASEKDDGVKKPFPVTSASAMDTATAVVPETFDVLTLGGNIASEKDDGVEKPFPGTSASAIDTATAVVPETFDVLTLGGNIASEKDNGVKKFFPVFDRGTTMCQNVGKLPSWISRKDVKQTKVECCRAYAFQWDYDTCLRGSASKAHAFASYSFAYNTHDYYPNFRKKSCRNDGRQPAWMAVGDYLTKNDWQCCTNNFHDDKLFERCYTACKDCNSDLHNDFALEPLVLPAMETIPSAFSATIDIPATASSAAVLDPVIVPATETMPAAFSAAVSIPATASSVAAAVESVLEANQDGFDRKILLYETPTMEWEPSTVYRFNDMVAALRVMYTDGIANKYFYMGDESPNGHIYGLVNIAAFLAQSMKETIKYNACDENSWDLVDGGYPLSNSCGQLGQSYQDYTCSASEAHMECPVKIDMEITATTNAKWWGAPAPLFCGPTSKYPFTGYWDHSKDCNNPWADPPLSCEDYVGQKGGGFNNESPHPNSSGRTDVEGCCFWGRGVIQTTGICNFGKLNYYLGARAAEEGRESRYPDINFCEQPDAICASQEHKELKWIAGMFYWVESLQSYDSDGWNYIEELKSFVDNGMSGNNFIDAVSGIVNRGCHNPPCASGSVDGSYERASNFLKVLTELDLV